MERVIWKPSSADNNKSHNPKRAKRENKRAISSIFASRVFWIVVGTFILVGSVIAFYFYKDDWVIQTIVIEGNNQIKSQDLYVVLDKYKGVSVFAIKPAEIGDALQSGFIEIQSVRAEKRFPDTLFVHVEEKIPLLLYRNFNGEYIVDKEGEILESVVREDANRYNFEEYEYQVARGFGSTEGEYVEDRVVSDLPEDELEDFIFEEYDIEQKKSVLETIIIEKRAKFESVLESGLSEEEVAYELPLVYVWEEEIYEVGQMLNKDTITFIAEIAKRMPITTDYSIDQVVWDGDLRMIVTTFDGPTIIFSPSIDDQRSAAIQFEDLESVLSQLAEKSGLIQSIDVSTDKILVEYYE
ncbi:FtsQ-type POTRA domain-containing protein [Candidatus Dojkabacteria bacterium]|uniref:FtsQ-type POTRA domain-containing protein n=1 Tax=Candidatus Dojkabacteria bacterium TaxID=2099670 RepID=A0A955L9G0_9BACT|nr:FtsQ-type POTRA domain-containing protein [Candidatus Dojkabacteria bacterium]